MQLAPVILPGNLPLAQPAPIQTGNPSATQLAEASNRIAYLTVLKATCALIVSAPCVLFGTTSALATIDPNLRGRDRTSLICMSIASFCAAGGLITYGWGKLNDLNQQAQVSAESRDQGDAQEMEEMGPPVPDDTEHVIVQMPDGTTTLGLITSRPINPS